MVAVQVLRLRGGGARSVLLDALQPPSVAMIDDAVTALVEMGALERTSPPPGTSYTLDDTEHLTALGRVRDSAQAVSARCLVVCCILTNVYAQQVLARLPLDVRLGKMLLWGVMLRCADPVIIMCAAMSARSPFIVPPGCMFTPHGY